jgi:putative DNA primase/helicase
MKASSLYSTSPQHQPTTVAQIEEALQFISPCMERDEWARVGMAIKSEMGEYGAGIFDRWSQDGDNYKASDTQSTWRSINGSGGIGIGTLFHMAIGGGYKPQQMPLIDPAQQAGLLKQRRVRAEQEQAVTEAIRAEVAIKANQKFTVSIPANGHEYLKRKCIQARPLRQHKTALIAPMYFDGKLVNLQHIFPDGAKRFLTGGRVSGCHHPIGVLSDHLYLCEGIATGYSIYEHTGIPVAVAFNCTNLKPVAISIRKKYPDLKITIVADNDTSTPGNPGLTKGRAAAAAVGGDCIFPTFSEGCPYTDFNDWFNLGGKL